MAGGLKALAAPVCATWVANVEEMHAWLKTAKAGERFVYCRGPRIVRGPAAARAAELYREGKVDLLQPKAGNCLGYDFMIQRRSSAKVQSRRSSPFDGFDQQTVHILGILTEAAERGRRCPSNRDLARQAGLATAQQAAWRVAKLGEDRIIGIETVEGGPDHGWRTVTILASGQKTLAPAGAR